MDETHKRERLEAFERLCRTSGSPHTVQRRVILEAVLELDCHPTADQVHERVRESLPNVSRTTVYRTLERLVRMGVITKACHPGRVVRFDVRTEIHHHLVCMRCDEVIDINDPRLDSLPIPDTSAFGFEVEDFRVQLRGLCRRCRAQEEES